MWKKPQLLNAAIIEQNISYEKVKKILRELIIESVRKSLNNSNYIAFSGGVDSTLIALIAKNILNKDHWLLLSEINKNDTKYSKKIIDDFSFKYLVLNEKSHEFDDYMSIMKYPSADYGLFALYQLWKNNMESPYITGIRYWIYIWPVLLIIYH